MKYSMTQWILGDQSLERTLQLLKKIGFNGIELTPDPKLYPDTKKIYSLFDKYGIEPSVMDLTPFHDLSHPDPAEREKAIEINKTMLDIAKELGCKKMLVCGTAVGRIRAISNNDEEWRNGVESVKLLADYAADRNVEFVMEVINHYETYMYYNVDRAFQFHREVNHENVTLMLDAYHMNIEEEDPCRAIRRVKNLLSNFHIADSNRCGVGHGHIDFMQILKTLKEIGYNGYIGLETQAPGPDPFAAIKTPFSLQTVEAYLEESLKVLKTMEKAIETPAMFVEAE